MATRPDIIVDFEPSPRIAIVDSPSVEFVVQDIIDTLRKREDTFRGQTENKLINASGKEDLGGGVQVGITAELQDTQIAFEGRTTPAETGTVTSNSSAPIGNSPARKDGLIELIDISADYVTTNIQRGSLVINFTDNSVAEVYSVISPTTLITRLPANGATNTHQIGDVYHVFNIIQCELIGGNLVGTDENGDALTPVSPTAFTQVIRTASSSATLSSIGGAIPSASENADAVWDYTINGVVDGSTGEVQKRMAFGDHIHVSPNTGVAGTTYPLGTHAHPINNIADAVTVGLANGIEIILLDEDVTILSTDAIDSFTIIGANALKSEITIQSGASTQLSRFSNCKLTGTLSGRVAMSNCVVDSVVGFEGAMINCVLESGGLQLSSTPNAVSYILDCYSGIPGTGAPEIDYNDTTHRLAIRGYNGGLKFVNKTQDTATTVDFVAGQLILDGTVTAGQIVVRGIYHLEDNSTGSPGIDLVRNTNLDTMPQDVWDVDAEAVIIGSHGLINRRSSFHEEIHVDKNNGVAGTVWPIGTADTPTNNITDAVIIGSREGIHTIAVEEDIIVLATDNIDGFIMRGSHATKSQINVLAGASTIFTEFRDCLLTGTLNGQVVIRESFADDVLNFEGVMFQTMISGTISLAGTQPSYLLSCYSANAGPPSPEIDFNGAGQVFVARDFSGGMKFVNKTGVEAACVDFVSGTLTLDGTVTAGAFSVRGVYELIDNSVGSPSVSITQNTNLDIIEIKIDNMQVDVDVIEVTVANMSLVIDDLIKYQRNKSVIDPVAFTLTIYEDNGVDVLTVFDLKNSGGVASVISIFQRIPQ